MSPAPSSQHPHTTSSSSSQNPIINNHSNNPQHQPTSLNNTTADSLQQYSQKPNETPFHRHLFPSSAAASQSSSNDSKSPFPKTLSMQKLNLFLKHLENPHTVQLPDNFHLTATEKRFLLISLRNLAVTELIQQFNGSIDVSTTFGGRRLYTVCSNRRVREERMDTEELERQETD